jgi:hypothetical protein
VIENAKPVHNPELLLTLDVQGFRAFVFNEREIAKPRFQPSQFWKRALGWSRQSRTGSLVGPAGNSWTDIPALSTGMLASLKCEL